MFVSDDGPLGKGRRKKKGGKGGYLGDDESESKWTSIFFLFYLNAYFLRKIC